MESHLLNDSLNEVQVNLNEIYSLQEKLKRKFLLSKSINHRRNVNKSINFLSNDLFPKINDVSLSSNIDTSEPEIVLTDSLQDENVLLIKTAVDSNSKIKDRIGIQLASTNFPDRGLNFKNNLIQAQINLENDVVNSRDDKRANGWLVSILAFLTWELLAFFVIIFVVL
jgi:hypothetical protein